jgi:glycogen synthase
MKKVLIMTPDIEGPVRNGGIGTAFTALATTLAKKGYDVDVLYTCGDYSSLLHQLLAIGHVFIAPLVLIC